MTVFSVLPASAVTLLFDFGQTANQTPGNWNNVIPATTVINNLVDRDGNITTQSLEVTDPFFDVGEPSSLGSESPFGAAGGYPVTATDDYLFGHISPFAGAASNPLGQLKLSGLTPGVEYSFSFFAGRTGVGDIRDAQYSVTGANSDSVVLNASNNESEVARVFGILPDLNDEILIDVERGPNNDNGNGFYYLGVMQVDSRPVPEPSALLILLSGTIAFIGKRRRA